MGEVKTTSSGRFDMREAMPLTAAWVDEQRTRFGKKHVNECIRAALGGERNQFYAVEAGHILGSAFDWTDRGLYVVSMSVLTGAKFVAVIRDPKGEARVVVREPGLEDRLRAGFEAFVSAPPFEYEVDREPLDEDKAAWPGTYRDIAVDLAWQCWCESARRTGAVGGPD